jgi:cell division protein FtsZ
MSVHFTLSQNPESRPALTSPIKVIGVGGGGSNAVNTMYNRGIQGVDFVVCNTDAQALDASPVPNKVQLGETLTKGRGAGSLPEVGRNAAIESLDEVLNLVGQDTSMVFITAGMGGGTGTGAAPVIARALRDMNILTVGIVTIPFQFEGKRRTTQAEQGLAEIRDAVDTLLIIRNDKLRELYSDLTMRQAFSNADNVLCTAAKGIAEVITLTGEINVDMNDVNTVMRNSGRAIMGSGRAAGAGRARQAVIEALESPLLNDFDIQGANFVLLNITYGTDEILMDEISEITDHIQAAAGSTAEVIWGYGEDLSLGDAISVTVIATGFEGVDPALTSPQLEARKGQIRVYMDDTPPAATHPSAPAPVSAPAPTMDASPVTPTAIAPERMQWNDAEAGSPMAASVGVPHAAWTSTPPAMEQVAQVGLAWNVSVEKKTLSPTSAEEVLARVEAEMPFIPAEAPVAQVEAPVAHVEAPVAQVEAPVAPAAPAATAADDMEFQVKVVEPAMAAQSLAQSSAQSSAHRIAPEEMQARMREREERLRTLRGKMSTSLGFSHLEQEPAYKRRKVILDDVTPSHESHMSNLAVSPETDENGRVHMVLTKNNSFFNDTVD